MKIKLLLTFLVIWLVRILTPNMMIDLRKHNLSEVTKFASQNSLKLDIKYEYNDKYSQDMLISQSIKPWAIIKKDDVLKVYISKGINKVDTYRENQVDELGLVPIMMYHGIIDTDQVTFMGNVDKDGYNRTKKAFINDLEFYYQSGYRMIPLKDYVNGNIDVELGKSPLIITFDDGLANNIKVLGLDDDGEIIIDPSSAVGILETFKTKYPDFNVTATFFLNKGLFRQPIYNEAIIKWLIKHNYDIGNHTANHLDFKKIDSISALNEVNALYNLLDTIIPNQYIRVVALPYGSPYNKEHPNFNVIMSTDTVSTLRVGYDANNSPFSKNFDVTFLKRIRAYDNNGFDFDIKMNFDLLKTKRYISDGNKDLVVIKNGDLEYLKNNPNFVAY